MAEGHIILQEWWEALKSQGPVTTIFGLIAYYFMRRADGANERHIETLKEEIQRLVKSRNRLEEIVLKKRLSSDEEKGGNHEDK